MAANQAEGNRVESNSILLVDDDPLQLKIMSKALKALHFDNVVTASNGRLAQDMLRGAPIDVILSDLNMPDINGLELLKTIRSGSENLNVCRNLPVVVMTGLEDSRPIKSALALDISGLLRKPSTPLEVVTALVGAMAEAELPIRSPDYYAAIDTSIGSEDDQPDTYDLEEGSNEQVAKKLRLYALTPGMRLAKDVRHKDGMLLSRAGCILTQRLINRLRDIREVLDSDELQIYASADH